MTPVPLPGGWEGVSVQEFLASLQLEELYGLFEREHITMDVLVDMTQDDLQSVGVAAFGHRHRILKKVQELTQTGGAEPNEPVGVSAAVGASGSQPQNQVIPLSPLDKDYIAVAEEVRVGGGEKYRKCYIFLSPDAVHHL